MRVCERVSPHRRRFRHSVPADLLSKRFSKKFEEETVQQAVKAVPHPRRKIMKRFAKDFFTTNFVKVVVKAVGLSGLIIAAATAPALAQKKYDTGATDTTI